MCIRIVCNLSPIFIKISTKINNNKWLDTTKCINLINLIKK